MSNQAISTILTIIHETPRCTHINRKIIGGFTSTAAAFSAYEAARVQPGFRDQGYFTFIRVAVYGTIVGDTVWSVNRINAEYWDDFLFLCFHSNERDAEAHANLVLTSNVDSPFPAYDCSPMVLNNRGWTDGFGMGWEDE